MFYVLMGSGVLLVCTCLYLYLRYRKNKKNVFATINEVEQDIVLVNNSINNAIQKGKELYDENKESLETLVNHVRKTTTATVTATQQEVVKLSSLDEMSDIYKNIDIKTIKTVLDIQNEILEFVRDKISEDELRFLTKNDTLATKLLVRYKKDGSFGITANKFIIRMQEDLDTESLSKDSINKIKEILGKLNIR